MLITANLMQINLDGASDSDGTGNSNSNSYVGGIGILEDHAGSR